VFTARYQLDLETRFMLILVFKELNDAGAAVGEQGSSVPTRSLCMRRAAYFDCVTLHTQ
jgi:hypothetical protein